MKRLFFTFISIFMTGLTFILLSCNDDVSSNTSKSSYSVVFDANGGVFKSSEDTAKTVSSKTVEVEEGKTVSVPDEPEKEKTDSDDATYFAGWYTSKDSGKTLDEEFNLSSPITKNIVLYANWLSVPEGSYLVTFESNCDTSIENQIVEAESYATKPEEELSKEGFAFSHWYKDSESEEFDFETTPIEETTKLSAKWNESGIYEADYEDDFLYSINVYESIELSEDSVAW